MKNILKYVLSTALLAFLAGALLVIESCKKDDDDDPNQIVLNSFGPSPALRGGKLRFIGQNLDKVTSVVLSDNVEVNTFTSKSATELVITVPDATVDGPIVLKTPQGDIRSKTILTISEPIAITAFSPAALRPGAVLTIEGTYLNLIKEVIFANKKSVLSTAFDSQSATKIQVKVPLDAQSGIVVLSNGAAEPILVETPTPLDVVLPQGTGVSPTPVKAGTNLTITGTDLDLVSEVIFPGGARVSTFAAQEAGKLELTVPADAKDGAIKLVAASTVETQVSANIEMKLPTVSGVSPTAIKPGGSVTISGQDLDLVIGAGFNGGGSGAVTASTGTSVTLSVPSSAKDGEITLNTAAGKSVNTGAVAVVKPAIASLAPSDIKFNEELTISGNDLDLVVNVKFAGGKEAAPTAVSANQVKVTVPVGTAAGAITVVSVNGDEVTSSGALNILPSTNATVTNMPASAKPGQMISIEGINLGEVTEVIFPVGVSATMFGVKTDVLIQVVVPMNVETGSNPLKLITVNGEEVITPAINIQGVDPVADPALVFFNFDGLNAWWGDAGAIENDPSLTLDGSSYFRVNQSCNGWTGFFWRNGSNNFPGAIIGTNVSNYVLKFDVNVLDPITGGEFAWRLKGSSGDHWYSWMPWAATGSYSTDGWITVSINLTDFSAGGVPLADLSTINEDFGVAFNAGTSNVNVCIDNVRFELK